MPHTEIVALVQIHRALIKAWGEFPHVSQPQICDLLPILPCLLPDHFKIVRPAIVLGHRDTVLSIQDAMPPIARDKDDLTRSLHTLIDLELWMRFLYPWQNEIEVHNRLIIFSILDDIPPFDDPL